MLANLQTIFNRVMFVYATRALGLIKQNGKEHVKDN